MCTYLLFHLIKDITDLLLTRIATHSIGKINFSNVDKYLPADPSKMVSQKVRNHRENHFHL